MQEHLRIREEIHFLQNGVIVQPSRQAFDATVGLGPSRRLGRNARQLAALAADNATDERGKGRQMLGQAAAGLARIPLFQGLMYGTIAPKVVTHRIPLLIRWIFQRGYTMRQPLLNVYIKMSYKSVRWRNRLVVVADDLPEQAAAAGKEAPRHDGLDPG